MQIGASVQPLYTQLYANQSLASRSPQDLNQGLNQSQNLNQDPAAAAVTDPSAQTQQQTGQGLRVRDRNQLQDQTQQQSQSQLQAQMQSPLQNQVQSRVQMRAEVSALDNLRGAANAPEPTPARADNSTTLQSQPSPLDQSPTRSPMTAMEALTAREKLAAGRNGANQPVNPYQAPQPSTDNPPSRPADNTGGMTRTAADYNIAGSS